MANRNEGWAKLSASHLAKSITGSKTTERKWRYISLLGLFDHPSEKKKNDKKTHIYPQLTAHL